MKISDPQRHRLNRDAAVTGKDVETMQNYLEQWTKQFADCPLLKGVLVEVKTSGSGDFGVNHKLGVKPTGFLVVKSSCTNDLYFVDADSKTMTLNTATASSQTWTIWVF